MSDDYLSYLTKNGLDVDVFFSDRKGGPISPEMRADWIETHEQAVAYKDIEYDNETGLYHFSFRVPDSTLGDEVRRKKLKAAFKDKSQVTIKETSTGTYVIGTTSNPGAAKFNREIIMADGNAMAERFNSESEQ